MMVISATSMVTGSIDMSTDHDYVPSAPYPDDTGCAECGRVRYFHRDFERETYPAPILEPDWFLEQQYEDMVNGGYDGD